MAVALFVDWQLSKTTVAGCVWQLADRLSAVARSTPDPVYLCRSGEALKTWCHGAEEALRTAAPRQPARELSEIDGTAAVVG